MAQAPPPLAASTVRRPHGDGAVAGEGVHARPSQCRIKQLGRWVYHPTAQMSRADPAATDSSLPPGRRGLGTILQEVPSQCMTRVLARPARLATPPTAHASR